MMTQGVDPELDVSDINRIKGVYEYCNQLRIPERHPYVGELVYTAFSGSHQDAINKGMKALDQSNTGMWEVPYLPIDPKHVGRSYEAIIRINSQSGKGGVAYIMEADYGLKLPRNLQVEMRDEVQKITDSEGQEIPAERIYQRFMDRYITQETARLKFIKHTTLPDTDNPGGRIVEAVLLDDGREVNISGKGTGPVDGFVDALCSYLGIELSVADYSEHSLKQGSDATAICYMEIEHENGILFGAGIHSNIVIASLEAILSAANRVVSNDY
jgi:2-isopropylmalate synthase